MTDKNDPLRLQTANDVRAYQRQWLADARSRAEAGEPFAICSSDEFEEIFSLLDVPVLVINYWNYLTIKQGAAKHYNDVLEARGYPGPHFVALGLATAIDPEKAPWGGLPKPSIIVGSTRTEYEMRVGELWAREMDCEFYVMDFNMQSPYKKILPEGWWNRTADDWEDLVDADRLQYRIEQNYNLIAHLEKKFGRTFSHADFIRSAELENEQMEYWEKAHRLIARNSPCPVSLRDQLAMYQPMWHRGTEWGRDIFRQYYEEVKQRVADGQGAYPVEKKRILYWSMAEEPAFHGYLRETYGAVLVGNNYSVVPRYYVRHFDPAEPMRAMASRHLFLFGFNDNLMVETAKDHMADGIIVIAPQTDDIPCDSRRMAEEAGIPFLELPTTRDNEANRAAIDRFMTERLEAEKL